MLIEDAGLDLAVTPDGTSRRIVRVHIGWTQAVPHLLSVDVFHTPQHPSLLRGRWVTSRATLRAGLTSPVTDVDLYAGPRTAGVLRLELRKGPRAVTVEVPTASVRVFLDELDARCPDTAVDLAIDELEREADPSTKPEPSV